jgi:hypothetical protein
MGTAAAVALAVLPGGPARAPGQAPRSAAAAVLEQAALTAARQPAAARPGPGQYIYAETIEGFWNTTPPRGNPQGVCVQTIQVWEATDGSGRQTAEHAAGPCTYLAYRSQVIPAGSQYKFGIYPQVADLPTALPALRQFVVRRFGDLAGSPDDAVYWFASGVLQHGAPPQLRAALFRLIAALPGLRVNGPMTDRLGRHGFAVSWTNFGVQYVPIFNPATTAVLERESIVVDPAKMRLPEGAPRITGVRSRAIWSRSSPASSTRSVMCPRRRPRPASSIAARAARAAAGRC